MNLLTCMLSFLAFTMINFIMASCESSVRIRSVVRQKSVDLDYTRCVMLYGFWV